MKYKTPLVALALSLVAATSQLSASDKYVDSAAGGSNNGSDWTNAYIDLQAALTAAKAPGSGITRICIAGGTYKPSVRGEPDTPRTETFQLINGVMIMGGYRGSDGGGDPNDRDIEAYETILSGDIGVEGDDSDNCYHVFCHDRIGLDNTAVLDGVTISGGNADGAWPHQNGGGMYNRVCSPELIDCEFTKNAATVQGGAICNYLKCSPEITGCSFSSNSSGEKGGAVYNHNGDDCAPEFFKCTFSGNTSLHGGAMFNSEFDGSPLLTITDCVFDSNSCGGLGGGIRNQQTSPIITNCIFSGNSSDDGGGGVFNYDNSNPTLTNCTFTGNEATDGGAMLSSSNCTPVVINCTIVGNSADDGGGGLHSVYNSTTTVVNSILWDNTATTAPQISGAAAVTYSCVEDGYTGTGNIVTDPLFVDADGADNVFGTADDDLHIENDSPCIDAGDNAVVPSSLTMDFEGAIRIQEDTVDMGADETPNYVVPWDTWPVIPIPDDIDTSKDDTLAVALIPRQNGMAFCGCPHCDSFGLANDLFDWAIPSLGGYTHESVINGWVKNHKGLMANLDHIRCKNCGRVYPRDCAGEDFPTDYTLGSNPLPANSMAGFTEQDPVPYYYKTGEAEGSRCYFEGTVWYKQKQWLAVRAAQYVIRANLPEIDDDARKWYARQAALIIYEFATAFPEYRVTVQARTAGDSLEYLDLEYVDGTVVSIDRGNSARFSYWVYKNVSVELAKAYYGILDVDIWNDLATDLNTTASHIHCQIQRQFFKPCVEEVLHRIDCESFQDKLMYGNMTGYMMSGIAWAGRSFAVCGAGTPPIGCSLCTGIGVGCDGLNPNPCNAETIIDTHVGPTYVHRAYEWLRRTTTDKNRFLFDGIWPEAASYHMQALIHIGFVVEALDQYNGDPNGYSYEPGHPTFPTSQPCDPNTEFQLMTLSQGALDLLAYPNSLFCPIGDTWPTDHPDLPSGVEAIEFRPVCGNLLLPGFGHAALGSGSYNSGSGDPSETRVEARLHWSGATTRYHVHRDNLSLSLWAFGREMICDLGYTHSVLRPWTSTTIGHNTVAIDRADQIGRGGADDYHSDGDLLLYEPNLDGFAVVEACGKRGYPGNVTEVRPSEPVNGESHNVSHTPPEAFTYRRMLIHVSVDEDHPYIVDIFHVHGGTVHDWLMHGSANHDQELTAEGTEITMVVPEKLDDTSDYYLTEAGDALDEEPGRYYKLIEPYASESYSGVTSNDILFKLRYTGDDDQLGANIHMLGAGNSEYWIGASPSIRGETTGGTMPQILARRSIASGPSPPAGSLQSYFISVIEPVNGDSRITSVESLAASIVGQQILTYGDSICRALCITRTDGKVHTILIGRNGEDPIAMTAGGVEMNGRVGLVVTDFLSCPSTYTGKLVGGTLLKVGATDLITNTEAYYDGMISNVTGDSSFGTTTSSLPSYGGEEKPWMIVTHGDGHRHGYEIDSVDNGSSPRTIYLTHVHGLEIDGNTTTETYFPHREFTGANTFRIYISGATP